MQGKLLQVYLVEPKTSQPELLYVSCKKESFYVFFFVKKVKQKTNIIKTNKQT
jgi:hypothetical protein